MALSWVGAATLQALVQQSVTWCHHVVAVVCHCGGGRPIAPDRWQSSLTIAIDNKRTHF
ncbi:hypothetical protein K443DRAFT_13368 [Laccaria amethystina LaAM-08-1]|uniref:Uncharacterized protein n=1 Tax=Laccaria amethystina LaAM-08-1 TaxID=1095629 RepID=A0A0C9WPC9_9AGAR|nr:hypothetical protein K443DRAFT_13368 [Laccaria amethystina LaAM-08-1]